MCVSFRANFKGMCDQSSGIIWAAYKTTSSYHYIFAKGRFQINQKGKQKNKLWNMKHKWEFCLV